MTVVAVEMLADDRVSLCTRYRLVAGNHRLAAARRLGWSSIPANIVEMDDLHRRLWAIDENLCRAELTELDRAEHLAQRKDIYEALHPEARHGGDRSRTKQDDKLSSCSFADDTASKTGMDARTIQRAVRRADRIDAKVKERIAATPIADSGVELDALASLSPRDQQRAVTLRHGRRRNVDALPGFVVAWRRRARRGRTPRRFAGMAQETLRKAAGKGAEYCPKDDDGRLQAAAASIRIIRGPENPD